jgi:single-strand DNA-binding protein
LNKIILSGRLTKDIEIKVSASGTEYCNFTIAVNRRAKKGEEKIVDFIDCSAFGKTSAFLNSFFHKGDGIEVEGRMESRKYADRDGNNRTAWGVTCDNVQFPVGKASKHDSSGPAESEFSPLEGDTSDLPF